jgi:hypothetical protein
LERTYRWIYDQMTAAAAPAHARAAGMRG